MHASPFPVVLNDRLAGCTIRVEENMGVQIFFSAFNDSIWQEPAPIRDTEWGKSSLPTFNRDRRGVLYATWSDSRNGDMDIFLAKSTDGGAHWSHNVRVNDDQTGQEQVNTTVYCLSNGTLCAVWCDNRNPKTLFDIYCAVSTDGGESWSRNRAVSDDPEPHFQIQPAVVLDSKDRLHCVWLDYRLKGMKDDLTTNIFTSTSTDGGNTWSANRAITSARVGHNFMPMLTFGGVDELHCAWTSTERSPNRDICYAYSTDAGRSWSDVVYVNPFLPDMRFQFFFGNCVVNRSTGSGVEVGYVAIAGASEKLFIATGHAPSNPSTSHPPPSKQLARGEQAAAFDYLRGKVLFADTNRRTVAPWRIASGSWIRAGEILAGYGALDTRCFTGSAAWRDYEISGEFKLDSIEHKTANIYFRTGDVTESIRCYRVHNFFRDGARLDYFDGKKLNLIAYAPYSFQKNRWYRFRTVVSGSRCLHFVDDSLLLRSDRLTQRRSGGIGLGTENYPTYFRRITVHAAHTR